MLVNSDIIIQAIKMMSEWDWKSEMEIKEELLDLIKFIEKLEKE